MTSIRKSLSSGILYTAAAKYSGIFISIVIGAVLARLLTPAEFGIVALVTVFVTFFTLLSDFGLGPAVVQHQSLDEKDIQSIFTFSIILGAFLSGLFFLATPLIAKFYNEPELIFISKLLSISILFHSILVIPKALLQKKLKFKQIGFISVIVQFSCGVIAIILARAGFSYYSLVIRSILSGIILFIIYYSINPLKPVLKIQRSSISKIIKFSTFQFLFNFINYFSRNADNLLIGKLLGSANLGYYDKAYRLMMMPVQNLTHVITPVLMPVLSKYQEDTKKVYDSYLKIIKLLAIIGFPLSIFLFFSADEIINILYGPQWTNSIPIFKILALTVGIQIILSSSGSIFQTVNRTDLLFLSGVLSAITMIGAICYGIFIAKSLEGVGYGLICAFCVNFFQAFYFLIHKALKNSFLLFLKALVYPIIISITISIFLFLFQLINLENVVFSIFSKIIISCFIYFVLVMSHKKYRLILKSELNKVLKKAI